MSGVDLQSPIRLRGFHRESFIFIFISPNTGTHLRIIIIFNLHTAAFKAYCAIWVRSSNFRH